MIDLYNPRQKPKKAYVTIITAAIIIAVFIISAVYYYRHTIINDGEIRDNQFANWIYQIDEAVAENGKLVVTGWCFEIGKDTADLRKLPKPRLILQESETGKIRRYSASYGIPRPEVNDYFQSEIDYTNCGFEAVISIADLNLQDHVYKIALQLNERDPDATWTDAFVKDGKLVYGEPNVSGNLETENTDLQEIIENGYLRVSRPDLGIYVYQEDWKLYWIVDDLYVQTENWEDLCYLIETTQADQLPEERRELELSFDNLGWYFSETEITDSMNTGKYRVAVRDIPDDYAVGLITTGKNEKGTWIWQERFYPRYDFR